MQRHGRRIFHRGIPSPLRFARRRAFVQSEISRSRHGGRATDLFLPARYGRGLALFRSADVPYRPRDRGLSGYGVRAPALTPSAASSGGARGGGRRNDAFHSHVARHAAVAFLVVGGVVGKTPAARALAAAIGDEFRGIGAGEGVVGFVALLEGSLQGRDEIGLAGFRCRVPLTGLAVQSGAGPGGRGGGGRGPAAGGRRPGRGAE